MSDLQKRVWEAMEAFLPQFEKLPKNTVFVLPLKTGASMIYTATAKEKTLLFNMQEPLIYRLQKQSGLEISLKTIIEESSTMDDETLLELSMMLMNTLPGLVNSAKKMDLQTFVQSNYATESMTPLLMLGIHQGGVKVHFHKDTNTALINAWQDAWASGLLDNENAKNCGWNASLCVLAIALHGIGQVPDPEARFAFGMDHEKANAFMKTMGVEQQTNLPEWMDTKQGHVTEAQYIQLQSLLLQLELGVLTLLHPRNAAAWWINNHVQNYVHALDVPQDSQQP